MKNLITFWKYAFLGGSGAEPTEASENIKNSSKNQWKIPKFWKFSWILKEFWREKLTLTEITANLMVFWMSLIILKEIKKPSGMYLRV